VTRRRLARALRAAIALPLVLGLAALTSCEPTTPTLNVRVIVSNLDIPWDLAFTPYGSMFFTERPGRISLRSPDGTVRPLTADMTGLWVSGETGLMGIVVDPAFNSNRRIYTCQGHTTSTGGHDVRVIPWVLASGSTNLVRQAPLVTGMPASSGRHGGCRLRIAGQDGHLFIGTGDAAIGTNPQDLSSLGGKVLRVNRFTGAGVSVNPFFSSTDANRRRVWSWGHRNVQGLAVRPADGSLWSVEHGTYRDDEVNRGVVGNFGWDPVPGYDETRPMTDFVKFPDAIGAAWSSGDPTVATSGATWLSGSGWEGWDGTLAVAALKDSSLRIMRLSSDGRTLNTIAITLNGTYGRLRTAQLGPKGRLYVTTSNGGGTDVILEVIPS